MDICDIMISRKEEDRRMSRYTLHLVALRDMDLSPVPALWRTALNFVESRLHSASPVKPVPWTAVKLVFEFETWDCNDDRIDDRPWWQGAQTDQQTADKMHIAVAFSLDMRKFCSYCLDSIKLSVSLQCTAMCRDRASDRVPPTGHRWVSHFYFTSFSMFSSMM